MVAVLNQRVTSFLLSQSFENPHPTFPLLPPSPPTPFTMDFPTLCSTHSPWLSCIPTPPPSVVSSSPLSSSLPRSLPPLRIYSALVFLFYFIIIIIFFIFYFPSPYILRIHLRRRTVVTIIIITNSGRFKYDMHGTLRSTMMSVYKPR